LYKNYIFYAHNHGVAMKKRNLSFWCLIVSLCFLANVVCTEKENIIVRNALNEKSTQQRNVIKERQKQQWLWNTAKIVGPLGLMAFTAYQLFKSSPIVVEQSMTVPLAPTQQETFTPVKQYYQPLIKEDILKYKQASKAYGAAAVWFSITALFDPFFYPYAAVNFMGSLYYGVKSLQLPLKPVVLEDIIIFPPDMPY
jgi:hypothetical protein